jgi:tRNA modification GTPase
MNLLLQKERAIVTSVPGTTRDFLEERLSIKGVSTVITDTAGIHQTENPVENIGITRTKEKIKNADLILFIIDASRKVDQEDLYILKEIKKQKKIVVFNKIDLSNKNDLKNEGMVGNQDKVYISAKNGTGINTLKEKIAQIMRVDDGMTRENILIPTIRQKKAMERGLKHVLDAKEGLAASVPMELVSIDLADAEHAMGEILGTTEKTDVLENIFNTFCIGK